jgi:hypothetical protein
MKSPAHGPAAKGYIQDLVSRKDLAFRFQIMILPCYSFHSFKLRCVTSSLAPRLTGVVISRRHQIARATPAAPQPSIPRGGSGKSDSLIEDAFFLKAPSPCVGPVMLLEDQADRGRGLAVSRSMKVGEVVLIEGPLASISEEDVGEESPDADLLEMKFEALELKLRSQSYSEQDVAWLQSLATLKDEETGKPSRTPSAFPDLSLGVDGEKTLPFPDSVDLEGLIQVNAFEADSEDKDLAYTALKQPPKLEVMGVWPRTSILNHSCSPNTISYSHQGQLITVTTRPISKGAELTTNYLGDLLMSPVDVRREALEDTYGFVCKCYRCKEEDSLDQNMKELVENIYESCVDQIREDFELAVEEDDEEAISELHDQLRAYAEVLDASFEKSKVKSSTQTFLQASLFELYELLFSTLSAQGEVDVRLVELLTALTSEIQPGSELNLYYSRLLLEEAQADEEEQGKEEVNRIFTATTMKAYSTRYGPLSRKMLKKILKEREKFEADDTENQDE